MEDVDFYEFGKRLNRVQNCDYNRYKYLYEFPVNI